MFSQLFKKQETNKVPPYNYKGLFELVILDKDSSYQKNNRVVSWVRFGIKWNIKNPLMGLYDYGFLQSEGDHIEKFARAAYTKKHPFNLLVSLDIR